MCGAGLHETFAKKPSKAWYLLPILFGIIGGVIGYFVIKRKDKKMAKNILYVGLGLFILSILLFAATPTPPVNEEAGISTTPTLSLITKSPSEIALTIDDLPAGWMKSGENGNDTHYNSYFQREKYGLDIIYCYVTKYPTIDDAKEAFFEARQENSDYKLVPVGLGDESFGWEYGEWSNVVFRKANVVISIEYYDEYGRPDIDDAKEYAKLVEEKIT